MDPQLKVGDRVSRKNGLAFPGDALSATVRGMAKTVVQGDLVVLDGIPGSWPARDLQKLGSQPAPVAGPIKSDGGSSAYYRLPENATELRHLISAKGMSFARGNLFKACYRLAEKDGIDALYDLKKMKFFVEDLIEMHQRGEKL